MEMKLPTWAEIDALYELPPKGKGLSLTECARLLGMTPYILRDRLRWTDRHVRTTQEQFQTDATRAKHKQRTRGSSNLERHLDEFVSLYWITKLTMDDIAKKYNCAGSSIRYLFLKHNIPIRDHSQARFIAWRKRWRKQEIENAHEKVKTENSSQLNDTDEAIVENERK